MITHHRKAADAQSKSRVLSSSIAVIGETAYMTVIPPLPLDPAASAGDQARQIFASIEARLASIGATVIVQDPASSAVWGMPGGVAEAGYACAVLDPAAIARAVAARTRLTQGGASSWK